MTFLIFIATSFSFCSAQAAITFTNLTVTPTSATVAAGGTVTVTVTGSASYVGSGDTVFQVIVGSDSSATNISAPKNCQPQFQSGGEIPINKACGFSLSLNLPVGAHPVNVAAFTWNGGSASSPSTTVTVTGPTIVDSAQINSLSSPPSTVTAGQSYTIYADVLNNGTTTWVAGGSQPYRLGAQNPQDNSNWGISRVDLPSDILPGGVAHLVFNVIAPATPGTYNFQWRMLHEYVTWFGPTSTNQTITVVTGPPVVGITSPANNDRIITTTSSAPVTLVGTATAATGATISSSSWSVDSGTAVSGSSYTPTLGLGYHTAKFTATDNRGNSGSAQVGFTVAAPNPTVTLSTPINGSTVTLPYGSGVSLNVVGTATANGTAKLSQVTIVDTLNGTATNFPVTVPSGATSVNINTNVMILSKSAADVHKLQINASDNSGGSGNSGQITYTVAKAPPSVSITAPGDGETQLITSGTTASVTVTGTATAIYSGATITKLEVLDNGAAIGTPSTTGSISAPVALKAGVHKLQLRATDSNSATALSAISNVTVKGQAPTGSLTTPINGQVFPTSGLTATVTFTGTGTPYGGATIGKLEVFEVVGVQNVSLVSSSTASLSASKAMSAGPHTVFLRVSDSTSQSTDLAPITFTVGGGDSAQFISQSIPGPMPLRAGQPYAATVTIKNTSTVDWPAGGLYRLGALNPQDNRIWNNQGRVYLPAIAHGAQATISIPFTAPFKPGTYNFQWGLVKEGVAWLDMRTDNVPITVAVGPGPTSTLTMTPTNVRVSGTASATLSFTGTGTETGKVISKIELFKDSGTGYPATATATKASGTTATMTLTSSTSVPAGNYWFKLRATDSTGVATDSAPVFVNVTNSALLGLVTGVRLGADDKPALVGWVCQGGGSTEALSYKVLLDAPTTALGGTLLTSGTANLTAAPDSTSVQSQCGSGGHQFNVDLSPYTGVYDGRSVYVYASNAAGTNIALPCVDNSCTMPGSMRIALSTPANNDRYQAPATVFMRAQISGVKGPYDEVAVSFDNGAWTAATADGQVPNSYYLSKASVATRAAQYVVQARVRKGNVTVYSPQNLITVGTTAAVQLGMTSPLDGATFASGAPITLSVTPTGTVANVKSLQFYDAGVSIATAVLNGSTWTANWTTAKMGAHGIVAKAFDGGGALLAQSSQANIVVGVSQGGTSGNAIPVIVTPPAIGTQDAGTLPGALSVGAGGDATYNLAIAVPPGTAGMQPTLALNYSSSGTNGIAGLGWSLSGLSSISRCGKTIAQDKLNGPISFTNADRLCMDGQRLVRVNSAVVSPNADPATKDFFYWTSGGEYRTEIDTLSRVTMISGPTIAGVSAIAFKVETKDGKIRYYGCDVNSEGCASTNASNSYVAVNSTALYPQNSGAPNKVGQAISWALSSIVDRSGNHIDFDYSLDVNTGEHLPVQIRYGGNYAKPQNHYAAVRFSPEVRQDAWTRYIADARNDQRNRLKSISTYINTAGSVNDQSGKQIRNYTLTYERSLSSGRSLLNSVQVCATDSGGIQSCLLPTTFAWGRPSGAAQAFVSQTPNLGWGSAAGCTSGAGNTAPCLLTHGFVQFFSTNTARYHPEYFDFSDFENSGRVHVLEKRVADPSSGKPRSSETVDEILAEDLSNPQKMPGTLQKNYRYFHNTGEPSGGFQQYTYSLDTLEYFAVLGVSDFDGDGYPDLLVLTSDSESAGGDGSGTPKVCLSPLASGVTANIVFHCSSTLLALGDNSALNSPTLIDVVGDGRASIYGRTVWDATMRSSAPLVVQDQSYTRTDLPPVLATRNAPSYMLEMFPSTRSFVGDQQMVDFSGTGKLEIAQWSVINRTASCVGPTCSPCPPQDTANCLTWNDTVPVVKTNSFTAPGAPAAPMFGYTHPITAPSDGSMFPLYSFSRGINMSSSSGDFNGSGYSSLFYGLDINGKESSGNVVAAQSQGVQCLSTGKHLDCTVRKALSSDVNNGTTSYLHTLAVADFDGDGQPDLLMIAVDNKEIPIGDTLQLCHLMGDQTPGATDTNVSCSPWAVDGIDMARLRTTLYYSSGAPILGDQVYLLDLMGTGRPQLVYYHAGSFSGSTWVEDGRWEVYAPNDLARSGEALDRIYSVANGLGATAKVTYVDGLRNNIVGKSGTSTLAYPQRLTPRTGKIVSSLSVNNGSTSTLVTNYHYWDAAMDAQGRGSLGFGKVEEFNQNSNITTTTSYRQGWPLSGMVDSIVIAHGGTTLSSTINSLQDVLLPQANGAITHCPYVNQSDTARTDLDGSAMGTSRTTIVLDDWCNVTQKTVSSWADPNQKFITDTVTPFNNDSSTWLIGLPQQVTITKTDPVSGSVTRRVGYGYYATTGLLEKETVEPTDAQVPDALQYQIATTYGRDPVYGLVNTVTQSWLDPTGKTVDWATTACSKPQQRTVSNTTYDPLGQFPQTVTNALCQQHSFAYDQGTGVQLSVIDPNGLTVSRMADGFGRLTKETDPQGNETRRAVKACGGACPLGASAVELVEVYNGTNQIRVPQLTYSDYAGHVLRTQAWGLDPNKAIVIDRRYDDVGRLQETDQPRFDTATSALAQRLDYDDLGRVTNVKVHDELGRDRDTKNEYHGLKVTSINPLFYTRTENRNVIGQLLEVIDAKSGSTKFSYEPFGNLANTWDPRNNKTTVVYDRWGRKIELRDPDLGFTQYKVDPLGMTWAQISNKQQGTGKQTSIVYDPLNRMTARYEVDLESHWVYDKKTTTSYGIGQLSEAYTVVGASKEYDRNHTYDKWGRLILTTQQLSDGPYSALTDYDAWGRVMTQTYQRGADTAKVFGWRYGQTGLLERVERGNLLLWQLTAEDASRRATAMVLGNDLNETKSYDPNTGRLMSGGLLPVAGGVAPVTEGYAYDALGNVIQRVLHWNSGGFTEYFTYDELNRLSTSKIGSNTLTFTYDAAGSIQTKTDVNTNATYIYPGQGETSTQPHALIGFGTAGGFAYDVNGNQITAPGRSATWTSFDMPLQLSKGGTLNQSLLVCQTVTGSYSCFSYGPEHQRLKQTRNDGTVIVYAGAQEVETKSGQVTVKTYWPNGLGVEIDRSGAQSTEMSWTYEDNLGSPIALTNEQGGIREKLAYDAWGKRRNADDSSSTGGAIDNKGFTGHEMLDQLDLVHMNGRVYDPLIGRFLSGDPLVQDPTNGQNYNRYSYVYNNPTNLTDPTGFAAGELTCEQRPHCMSISFDQTSTQAPYRKSAVASSVNVSLNSSGFMHFDAKGQGRGDGCDSCPVEYVHPPGREDAPGIRYRGSVRQWVSELTLAPARQTVPQTIRKGVADYNNLRTYLTNYQFHHPASGQTQSLVPDILLFLVLGPGGTTGRIALEDAAVKGLLPSAGGVVRQFEQVGDKVYYRVFSGDANVGGWLTAVPPRSSAWAQEALALPPSNTATMIQEVLVPNGTLLERSRAIPMPQWGRMRGGAEQFKLLDEIPLRNFGPGSPLP
ncbi:RHS repeat-associated core domain-containing protein [Duganella sp. CT11-25]|uniref:RHS repeat-associated core domain-containing protein n=1 Tax=unclassified Duganella TaxID=2636909 RepID=UPI0039AF093C